MSYLKEKNASNVALRQNELEYKNKALEVEKNEEDAMVLEEKRFDLQAKQIEMQFEMLRSFTNSSSKHNQEKVNVYLLLFILVILNSEFFLKIT